MSAGGPDALARARAAALAELRARPTSPPWRRQAAVVAGASALMAVVAAVAAGLASLYGPDQLAARWPVMLSLLAVGVLAGVAALAPHRRAWLLAAVAGAAAAMVALVASRAGGGPSATPEWVCSVSHVGVGLIPLGVALWGLRQAAWTWPRALAAGLGAGTAGALLGELACLRGPRHVAVHHLGAWLVVTLVCVALSRRARPRTFAP